MNPDKQLPHLNTFSTAAELGSFTAAAKALGLTQAAVSQRVQALEKALGRSLFDRRGGRVLLTDAGRTLHGYAGRIADLYREARRAITGRETPVAGELVIAATSVPGEYLLPALLSAFGKRYPHVRVRAAVSDSAVVIGQVERGEVSVGLVGRKTDGPHLAFRHLASDRMVLVAPPGHPLTKTNVVMVGRLAAHPLVPRETGSGLRHCFEQALGRAGRSFADLRVALELDSNEAIKEAVRRGVGVAVLSAPAVEKELVAGSLRAIEVRGLRCGRKMFVVRDGRRVLPVPANVFLSGRPRWGSGSGCTAS